MSDCIKRGLHIPSGTPSGIDSWVDYSKRMKPEDAKDADWDHFCQKYCNTTLMSCNMLRAVSKMEGDTGTFKKI